MHQYFEQLTTVFTEKRSHVQKPNVQFLHHQSCLMYSRKLKELGFELTKSSNVSKAAEFILMAELSNYVGKHIDSDLFAAKSVFTLQAILSGCEAGWSHAQPTLLYLFDKTCGTAVIHDALGTVRRQLRDRDVIIGNWIHSWSGVPREQYFPKLLTSPVLIEHLALITAKGHIATTDEAHSLDVFASSLN
jgi:hypothetical protein